MRDYAELQVTSNYSFLRGASHPEELVLQAAALGLGAIAITDRNSLAGAARAHVAARAAGIRLLPAARLVLEDAPDVLCYPTGRAAYGRLSRLLSLGKRRAPKGQDRLYLADLADAVGFGGGRGQILAVVPPGTIDEIFPARLRELTEMLDTQPYLAATVLFNGGDAARLEWLAGLGAPLLATGDVHAHVAARRPLQDTLTCIREHCTITHAGYRLFANAERHLKGAGEMAELFAAHPDAITNTLAVAAACRFSLDELRYEYPIDPVPAGSTPQRELQRLARGGARARYPKGVPDKVARQIEHELALIGDLGFAPYFLTVHDIVSFARGRGILCQGRGSAANSAVCYALGITAVDPDRIDVLFERFISAERGEPPDIDVDFEHERREEVIQYVYAKYGRERAAMTATVITYRTKSAIREVAKVMGLTGDVIQALQAAAWRRDLDAVTDAHIREHGLDADDPALRLVMRLAGQLRGFPRHLSQHPGGMVITQGPLCELIPLWNAAMQERTAIEWSKDDLDALGILKIDLLGLGMLSCVRRALALIGSHHRHPHRRPHRRPLALADIPPEDAAVYDMLCRGDSVGVFQVESRAQMSMLPRLKPRCFYDLVIQVAIVRPGPIQGDMVHPYLRRRNGEEQVAYPSDALRQVLGKTLGVPLFQEQAMKIAIVGAGFSPAEADGLRRAMASFRHHGTIHAYEDKFKRGMLAKGYQPDFAARCFKQIEGFADYGFPESHAASFALIVYVSAWIKCHYPAAFACALLNSQPMGFYAPAQIVRDARQHGVPVRAADVNASGWDCSLEDGPALRLGLRQIKGLREQDAAMLVAARGAGYTEVAELAGRAGLGRGAIARLARADAFASLDRPRRAALWAAGGLDPGPPPELFAKAGLRRPEPAPLLPPMALGEQVAEDYRSTGLSLKAHPMAVLRGHVRGSGFQPCARTETLGNGQAIAVAGLVTARQRPGSAKGVLFITIEDETGIANLIVWPQVFERFRAAVLGARLLGVRGRVQRDDRVIHLIAAEAQDLSPLLAHLHDAGADAGPITPPSRDFH